MTSNRPSSASFRRSPVMTVMTQAIVEAGAHTVKSRKENAPRRGRRGALVAFRLSQNLRQVSAVLSRQQDRLLRRNDCLEGIEVGDEGVVELLIRRRGLAGDLVVINGP